jgi:hypothetical protein
VLTKFPENKRDVILEVRDSQDVKDSPTFRLTNLPVETFKGITHELERRITKQEIKDVSRSANQVEDNVFLFVKILWILEVKDQTRFDVLVVSSRFTAPPKKVAKIFFVEETLFATKRETRNNVLGKWL